MPQITRIEVVAAVFYALMALIAAYFLFRPSSPNPAPAVQTGQAEGQEIDAAGYSEQFRISIPVDNQTAGTTAEMVE
ncbi:MAG: hypothetical protein WC926_04795 [Candidatus Paceibacterota bacterium]|jgi:hypothetical protein